MREVKSADRAARPHGETFRELDAGVFFRVEQIPENFFLGVVWRGGITRRRSNTAIFFFDQIIRREFFQPAKTPFVADAFVEILGERFRQTIGNGFGENGVVIVVFGFELLNDFF